MSMKISAGDFKKGDLFLIDPNEIVVDAAINGRAESHTYEEIASLAASIMQHGQQQPCVVRRIEGNKVQLVSGYGRHRAVMLINKGKPAQPFPLKCTVTICNDEQAFLRNIAENRERRSYNAIDDAYNQQRLREVYGWSEKAIQELYDRSAPHINNLRKLLRLDKKAQKKVSQKKMSVATALDLAELPAPAQQETLDSATDATGHVNGRQVRETVRKKKQEQGGAKPRTLSEVRLFFDALTGEDVVEPVRDFCTVVVDFIAGRSTEKRLEKALRGLVPVSEEEEVTT